MLNTTSFIITIRLYLNTTPENRYDRVYCLDERECPPPCLHSFYHRPRILRVKHGIRYPLNLGIFVLSFLMDYRFLMD